MNEDQMVEAYAVAAANDQGVRVGYKPLSWLKAYRDAEAGMRQRLREERVAKERKAKAAATPNKKPGRKPKPKPPSGVQVPT